MGLDILCDFFRLRRQTELLYERSRRLFDGRVATQKLYAARLQALDADVLVGGIRAAGIVGRIRQGWSGLARIVKIVHGRFSGLRVVLFFQFSDPVFLPD